MANHQESNLNIPNDLSSAQDGQQFSFSSPTTLNNQTPISLNPSPSLAGNTPTMTLSNQDIQTMALQLQTTAHWLGQIMQQRGLSTPVNALPVVEEPRTDEPQPTSARLQTNNHDAGEEEEPEARIHGRRAREMIENEEVDDYSAETTRETGTETEEEECSLGKRSSPEDEKMNQKLKRLKEQLLAELGKKDQSQTSLPTSSPFSKLMQQETVPKKFMMPPMAAYNGAGNPREHVMNYKTFMELQTLSDALMCKVFPITLTGPART